MIKDGWAICPYCRKKQFPIGEAKIYGLNWKCCSCKKHFNIHIPFLDLQDGAKQNCKY